MNVFKNVIQKSSLNYLSSFIIAIFVNIQPIEREVFVIIFFITRSKTSLVWKKVIEVNVIYNIYEEG